MIVRPKDQNNGFAQFADKAVVSGDFTEKLNEAIVSFFANTDDIACSIRLMELVVKCVISEEPWLVPIIDICEDGQEGKDFSRFSDVMFIESRNGYVRDTTSDDDGKTCMLVYTDWKYRPDDVSCEEESVKSIFEAFLEAEEIDRICLNNGEHGLWLSRQDVRGYLHEAEEEGFDEVIDDVKYILEPYMDLNTQKVIDDWRDDWKEEPGSEDWKLECYPVMPDGSVLVTYSMDSEIYDHNCEAIHRITYFRVLQYRRSVNEEESEHPTLQKKFRFKVQDARLIGLLVNDGVLLASIEDRLSGKCSICQFFPNDDKRQYSIGKNVERVLFRGQKGPAVSYKRNPYHYLEKEESPLLVFYEEGRYASEYPDAKTLGCRAVTIDNDEHVWTHMFPSREVIEINDENLTSKSHAVDLQGFSQFGLSDDKTRLVACFGEHPDECLIQVMRLQENGSYDESVPFTFTPYDDDYIVMDIDDCNGFYGCPSICKSVMVLRAKDKLFWYDLNAFC